MPTAKAVKKPVKKSIGAKAKGKRPTKAKVGKNSKIAVTKKKAEVKKRLLERQIRPRPIDILTIDARSAFTMENLKLAFCKSLACTGIGAANTSCDNLLAQQFDHIVPANIHVEFPSRLLACATRVCSSSPYSWQVDQVEPTIKRTMTFQDLLDTWFRDVVWPGEENSVNRTH